jgi:hypothetical protein
LVTAEAAFTRSWSVGRYKATLCVAKPRPGQLASAVIEWEPHMPTSLSPREVQQYRDGRAEALSALGRNAAVIEL